MKKISTLFLSLFIGFTAFAQNPTNKIVLTKNQLLKFTSSTKATISQDMMGQTMETLMDVTSSKNISVKDVTESNYQIEAVTTRIKLNMSLMGQDKIFDSDNKDDMAGELKDAGKDINKIKTLVLSTNGTCKPADNASPEKSEEDTNPMTAIIQQMMGGSAEEITTAACFMLIPQAGKIGDIWADTLVNGTTKTIWNYTWNSTLANIAIIKATSKETNNSTVNAMGMDMTINMINDIAEIRKVDINTGMVVNNNSIKKINGTIDIMGQSVPMTGTATSITMVE